MHCFPKIQSICIDYLNSVDACSMVLYMINFYKLRANIFSFVKTKESKLYYIKPRHEPLQRALCDPLDAGRETGTELLLNLAPRYPAGEQQSPRAGSGGDVSVMPDCH